MDAGRRKHLIERYRDGYRVVSEAVRGLTDAELDRVPLDGSWSARRVVHHLADSEMTSAIRLRRLIAEERPVIQGYDEMAFADSLYYDGRPIGASLDALKAARATSADILERLTEANWAREGTHSESGRYSVETWLEIYAAHAHDHAEQIRRAAGEPSRDGESRESLFARYREGYRVLNEALAGIEESELDTRPAPGEWTVREIVHHLADSATITAIRLRRLVVEDRPVLEAWNEAEYARRLSYGSRPIGPSLEAVRAAIETTTAVLERVDEGAWTRPATHAERGEYNLGIALRYCAGHVHDHAEQIRRIRQRA